MSYNTQLTKDVFLEGRMNAENRAEVVSEMSEPEERAARDLTFTGITVADETITIGLTVITIEATAVTANSIVTAVALSLADAATSVKEFVNGTTPSVSGVTFNARTFAEAVTATSALGVVTVTAIVAGETGNAIAVAETQTNATWAGGAVFLAGGVNKVLLIPILTTSASYADDAEARLAGVPVGGVYRVDGGGLAWRTA
jgi:hypothetical protein